MNKYLFKNHLAFGTPPSKGGELVSAPILGILCLLFFSCAENSKAEIKDLNLSQAEINDTTLSQKTIQKFPELKNVSFDFEAKKPKLINSKANQGHGLQDFANIRNYKDSNDIVITATLSNSSSDTIYFLGLSDGLHYFLKFDTAKFVNNPKVIGNANWTVIYKIAPKNKLVFDADIKNKTNEDAIQLGFEFFICKKDTELLKHSNENILRHPKEQQTILWAKKKKIQ